jgi:hypothetical protein
VAPENDVDDAGTLSTEDMASICATAYENYCGGMFASQKEDVVAASKLHKFAYSNIIRMRVGRYIAA